MNKSIAIDRRGTMTLPKPMRTRLALPEEGGMLVAEVTAEGILLRPGVVVPVEIYSKERIAEFQRADDELRDFEADLKIGSSK